MDPDSTDEGSPEDKSAAAPDTPTPGGGEGGLLKALDEKSNESKPALRPEQVANAVSFLTNPKVLVCMYRLTVSLCPSCCRKVWMTCFVQGSTSGAKRSFLLGKGLTDEEIDSAIQQAKLIMPVPTPVATAQPAAPPAPTPHAMPAPSTVAGRQSTEVQTTPMGDLQASWTRITAAVVLVGFATVGMGSVAMPYLKKGWRWFMGTGADDSDISESKKLSEVLEKQAQQQQELFKQVKDVATAVKTLQVLSSIKTQFSPSLLYC